ncbi:Mtr2 protein [Saccharomycopsis crataegensis]|uniref:Mtr2 protein n=1 Tax=Saccharomycopsis crataegensis TaxID=43959 RepID=A0AAV5QW64_9ASCO|nr:Mtr2 protein [Saccharomycopsis crataegensis]
MSSYVFSKLCDSIIASLDSKPPANSNNLMNYNPLPQLRSNNVKILINASPLTDKRQFTEYWIKLPLTQHKLQSYDYHTIPGMNMTNLVINGKVRFNENGKNKLGESAEINPMNGMIGGINNNNNNANDKQRAIWGSWFGFTMVVVIDGIINENTLNSEFINSFNYKITYIAGDSVMQV